LEKSAESRSAQEYASPSPFFAGRHGGTPRARIETAQGELSTDILFKSVLRVEAVINNPRGFQVNPIARRDTELFQSIMDGDHCLRGFTNRDIRQRLVWTPHLQKCGQDPKKASAKISRIFRRFRVII